MTAVMRSPTRTKTKSLGGRQNDFKFPSIEALPRFVLHEEDLNNHYIVNEVFSKSPVLKARDDNESQLVSEYTSVSNTNTNTNSSNGYYSFANISDNTTASRMNGTLSEASYGVSSTTSRTYKSSDYSTAYDTEHPPFSSTASSSSHSPSPRLRPMNSDRTGTRPISAGSIVSKSTPPMEAILEDEQSLHSGEPLAYDVVELVPSSRVDPLPQARVVTVRSSSSITSSTTVESNHSVGVDEGNRQLSSDSSLTYTTAPSYNPLMENSKGSYDPYSQVSGRQRQRQPGVRQVSKLKRSNAIRCKGGLLRFFSQLGIRIKRRFRRLWLAVRRKLFSYSRGRSSGSISRSKSMHSVSQSLVRRQTFATEQSTLENITLRKRHRVNGHEMKRSLSSGNKLTTSHLRRTHGLVSNLQSLPPQDSAAVATTDLSIISSIKSPGTPQRVSFGKHGTSSTLRRTNSSIRRAASILEASMSKMDHNHNGLPITTSWKLDTLQESPELEAGGNKPNTQLLTKDQLATSTTLQNRNNNNDKPSANLRRPSHLVRSRGSNSLSSIIRQPSIVVKNKVIPLSMCNYSMSVRNGNRVACWDTLSAVESQSSIDSSYFEVNQPLSGGKDDIKGRITVVRGTSKDFEREKDKAMETIEEKANDDDEEEDTTELVPNRETVSSLFNSYFRRIIYERVKLQLQMDRLQESSQEDICSIYRELLDSIHVYEDGTEEEEEEQDEVEEEEGQQVPANGIVAVNHGDYKVRGRQLSTEMFVFPSEVVSRESDSDVVSRLAPALYNSRRGSILSIPGSTVGRSLTLPMGIKV